MKEKDLQKFAENYLRLKGYIVVHVPNVICRVIHGKFMAIKVNSGNNDVSDIIAFSDMGRVLLIELKADKGKLSDGQKRFKEWCVGHGHYYYLCRSQDEVIKAEANFIERRSN